MKKSISKWILNVVLAGAGVSWLQATLPAATFGYVNCDLVAGFRSPGGASDLVVDIGPVAYYEGLPAKTTITVTNISTEQLSAAFPGLNDLVWSVSGAMRGNVNYPQYPLQSIWVTAPVSASDASVPVWVRKGQFALGTTAAQIDAIGAGGIIYGSTLPAGPNNTSTGIIIPSTEPNSYTAAISATGDFAGTFQGNVENTTADDFETANTHSRSILYALAPASGADLNTPGKVIGFFDFASDGTMTFTSGPPIQKTSITSIQRSGSTVTISFSSVASVSYRLRATDAAGLFTPVSSWNIIGGTTSGNGSVQSIQEANAPSGIRFYAVEAF